MQTQFVTNSAGKKVSAIIPIKEFNLILEKLDELACIKAYDKAKSKKQEFIPLSDALQKVEKSRSLSKPLK